MVVRAAAAAMVIAVLYVILCVSCDFVCGVQLLHIVHAGTRYDRRARRIGPRRTYRYCREQPGKK